jgi:hypothetical protein
MYTAYPDIMRAIPMLGLDDCAQLGRILLRPFLANLPRASLILLIVLRYVCCEWIVRVGRAEKRLYRQEDSADL